MKLRFRMFRRRNVFWCQDNETGKQTSLQTKDRQAALGILHAKNEAFRQPALNLSLARVYLSGIDPRLASRTWATVMEELMKIKTGVTRERYAAAIRDTSFDVIRDRAILETQSCHFLKVLESGTVSTNVFLRRFHNFALSMNWLHWPVLPKRHWPAARFKEKRAITFHEHQRIIQREPNDETRAFYELSWHLGASQSDLANLHGEDIDWDDRVISYLRKKNQSVVQFHFGPQVEELLQSMSSSGPLFPRLAGMHEKHRAKEFNRRCKGLGIRGISLHSYRYAWAERAKAVGYPERFAQEALGHNSKAVHRVYSRKAKVKIPSLEGYEAAHEGDLRKRVI